MARSKKTETKSENRPTESASAPSSMEASAGGVDIAVSDSGAVQASVAVPEGDLGGSGDSAAPQGGLGGGSEIFDSLKGVPIDYLIATPLMSAAKANLALARSMMEFIDEIGFDDNGDTRLITFNLSRPVQETASDGSVSWLDPMTIEVQAPLLSLVPIPALLVDSVSIELVVEVASHESTTSNTNKSVDTTVKGGWGWGEVTATGSVSTTKENTRSSDYSAKYTVNVQATQQPTTEGMSKLTDIMASCIEAVPQ